MYIIRVHIVLYMLFVLLQRECACLWILRHFASTLRQTRCGRCGSRLDAMMMWLSNVKHARGRPRLFTRTDSDPKLFRVTAYDENTPNGKPEKMRSNIKGGDHRDDNENDEDDVEITCAENFRQYLLNSTLHGLRYVGDVKITIFER